MLADTPICASPLLIRTTITSFSQCCTRWRLRKCRQAMSRSRCERSFLRTHAGNRRNSHRRLEQGSVHCSSQKGVWPPMLMRPRIGKRPHDDAFPIAATNSNGFSVRRRLVSMSATRLVPSPLISGAIAPTKLTVPSSSPPLKPRATTTRSTDSSIHESAAARSIPARVWGCWAGTHSRRSAQVGGSLAALLSRQAIRLVNSIAASANAYRRRTRRSPSIHDTSRSRPCPNP